MKTLLTVLFLLAGPAHATQDAWPALYDVTGVGAGDVLNVREGPSARTRAIGSLSSDARGVEILERDEPTGWGRVNLPEGPGWVSMRYLSRRPGQWAGAFPPVAACFGTEPFWRLELEGEAATWSVPGGEVRGQVEGRLSSAARRDRYGLVLALGEGRLAGVIAARACSDGMSDRLYGLAFDAVWGDDVFSGCCTLAP